MAKGKKDVVRRNAAQGHMLVEQWRQSGESMDEFCRRQAVGTHVLRHWLLREAKPTKPAAGGADFFVVSAAESSVQRSAHPVSSAPMPAGDSTGDAVIILLPAATPRHLAQTVKALLKEARQ